MLYIYLLVILVMSLITFGFYFVDKMSAKAGGWRIPEKVLFTLGFSGGAIGALAAMQIFRHKTRHLYFYVFNVLSLLVHIALAVLIVIFV